MTNEMVIKNFSADIIKDIPAYMDRYGKVFNRIEGFEQAICSTPKMKALIKEANAQELTGGWYMDKDGAYIKRVPDLSTIVSASLSIANDYIIDCYGVEEFKFRLAKVLEVNPEDIDLKIEVNFGGNTSEKDMTLDRSIKKVNKQGMVIKNFSADIIKDIKGFEDEFRIVFNKIKGFEQVICSNPKMKALIKEANAQELTGGWYMDKDGAYIKRVPDLGTILVSSLSISEDYLKEYYDAEEFKIRLAEVLEVNPEDINIKIDIKFNLGEDTSEKDVNKFIDTDSFANIADDIRATVLARVNDQFKDINVITIIEGLQKASLFHLVEFKDKNNYVLESCEALSNGSKVQLIFTDTDTVLKYKI